MLWYFVWGLILSGFVIAIGGALRDWWKNRHRKPLRFEMLKRGERVSLTFLNAQTIPIGFFPENLFLPKNPWPVPPLNLCRGMGACMFCGPYDWAHEQGEGERTALESTDGERKAQTIRTWDGAAVEGVALEPGTSGNLPVEER